MATRLGPKMMSRTASHKQLFAWMMWSHAGSMLCATDDQLIAESLEPRPGLEPGTCRLLQAYRSAGSKGLFPHLTSRFRAVFGTNCSQVVRKKFPATTFVESDVSNDTAMAEASGLYRMRKHTEARQFQCLERGLTEILTSGSQWSHRG